MRCESALIRLDELRTGELDEREVEAVREHLERCGYCDRVFHRIADIAENARALYGECPSSCAEALERRLFDRCAKVTLGGLDLWVAFSEHGLTSVALAGERGWESFAWSYTKRFGRELRRAELPEPFERQLRDALRGRGVADPRVDLSALPAFERRVLQALVTIPSGEVRSYAWVAREAGRPDAVRAVGNVCAHNPLPLVVPCHRVVPATGGVGDYGYGPEMKRRLLEREGVDLARVDRLGREKAKYVKVEEWYCFPTCRHARSIPEDELVPVRDEREAAALRLEPCSDCRPLVTAA